MRQKLKMHQIETGTDFLFFSAFATLFSNPGSSISSCPENGILSECSTYGAFFLNTSILSDKAPKLCARKSWAILRRRLDGETFRSGWKLQFRHLDFQNSCPCSVQRHRKTCNNFLQQSDHPHHICHHHKITVIRAILASTLSTLICSLIAIGESSKFDFQSPEWSHHTIIINKYHHHYNNFQSFSHQYNFPPIIIAILFLVSCNSVSVCVWNQNCLGQNRNLCPLAHYSSCSWSYSLSTPPLSSSSSSPKSSSSYLFNHNT